MARNGFGLARILAAAESTAPGKSVDVVAQHMAERFGAFAVSLLFVDLVGQALVRLPTTQAGGETDTRGRVPLAGSIYDEVLRTQRIHREPRPDGGSWVLAPVTNRGDTIGVLELTLPEADDDVVEQVRETAHALAYILVADRRFTDLYHWGQRTTAMSLAAEIQHQLLPTASCCEAAQFTLAAALVPADDVGGDSYDFALDPDALHVSITDVMGHDVNSALMANLLLGALRGARRAGRGPGEQADRGHQALVDHGHSTMATGQLLRLGVEDNRVQIVNAGHPWPLRLRAGVVEQVPLEVDLPFGAPWVGPYRAQDIDLQPGDRLILLTDGMQEREAETVDLRALLHGTRHLHAREVARALTSAVSSASQGHLSDDATVLCLDWRGAGHDTEVGAEEGTTASLGRPYWQRY